MKLPQSKFVPATSSRIKPGDYCVTKYAHTGGWKYPQAMGGNKCLVDLEKNDLIFVVGKFIEVIHDHPKSYEWMLALCKGNRLVWLLEDSFKVL